MKKPFVEPLAEACEILEQVNTRNFRAAAMLGDWKLAQLIARVLRTTIPSVAIYGKYEKKLTLPRRVGMETKNRDAIDLNHVCEHYLLLVEAAGSPRGLELSQKMTEPHGTLVLKSSFMVQRRWRHGRLC